MKGQAMDPQSGGHMPAAPRGARISPYHSLSGHPSGRGQAEGSPGSFRFPTLRHGRPCSVLTQNPDRLRSIHEGAVAQLTVIVPPPAIGHVVGRDPTGVAEAGLE